MLTAQWVHSLMLLVKRRVYYALLEPITEILDQLKRMHVSCAGLAGTVRKQEPQVQKIAMSVNQDIMEQNPGPPPQRSVILALLAHTAIC